MQLNGLLSLLLYLLIGGLVVYIIYWIVGMLALPAPVKNIILAIVAIVVLIWLLSVFVPGMF